jgi:uncharacterized protein (TIGR03435 family)
MKNIRETLEQGFERAQRLPAAESKPAWERLMERSRENGEGVFEGPEFADPIRVKSPVRRVLWVAAAAAAVVLAVLVPMAMRPPAAAVLEVAARNVRFGEAIKSEMFGEVVKLEDGSRIEMKTNSELVLERADDGVRIRLDKGDIVVTAAKQHGHLYVETKDVTVSVVGTVFYVKAEREGSRVAVFEGEVRVKQGQTEKKLGPGDQVASNPKMESIPVREQVAWSREAVTHMAVLPQAPAPKERIAFEEATIRPAAAAGPAAPGVRGDGGGNGANSGPGSAGCVADSSGYAIQIDPQRFAVYRTTVLQLVSLAYPGPNFNRLPAEDCGVRTSLGLLTGVPEWTKAEMWDLQAIIPAGVLSQPPNSGGFPGMMGNPNAKLVADPKFRQMVQTLLAERFKVVLRRETREIPAYLLKVGKDGTKFNGQTPGITYIPAGLSPDEMQTRLQGLRGKPVMMVTPGGSMIMATGRENGVTFTGANASEITMESLARQLSGRNGRVVIDQTGLTGAYNFNFQFDTNGVTRPTFEKALEGVGLILVESKTPMEVLILDRAEKPSEN